MIAETLEIETGGKISDNSWHGFVIAKYGYLEETFLEVFCEAARFEGVDFDSHVPRGGTRKFMGKPELQVDTAAATITICRRVFGPWSEPESES